MLIQNLKSTASTIAKAIDDYQNGVINEKQLSVIVKSINCYLNDRKQNAVETRVRLECEQSSIKLGTVTELPDLDLKKAN